LAAQSRLVGNEDIARRERGPTRIRKRRADGNKDDRGDLCCAGNGPGDYYGSPSHARVSFAPAPQGDDADPSQSREEAVITM
jgi:hypothetical protein